ncbi:RsmB/NOP family class I SAM-dependent RNA methyltransferase [Georgenia yuyongxinii]|uniref:rRNA small subunit methyltransferase B n=1 Tax=Georgenia yuyongxinii TaxID=2589797 RepID=A0A552WVD7_9MICO|nr:transcription antitermination factor NusB [Georgenia yuyongxinii]TRW46801.1 rRNA small subunit methyltransferase B [Georgenia yuyongxinii]
MSDTGGTGRGGPSGGRSGGGGRGGANSGGRGGASRQGGRSQPRRRQSADAHRRAAYDVLRQVAESDAYANLVLPGLLRERGITGRDAAFVTELTYGTLRLRGRYDAVLARCTDGRRLETLDAPVLDLLRLGAHQLLGMRVPTHAAVSETVTLAREVTGPGPAGLVNAVLRAVSRRSLESWLDAVGDVADPERTDAVARLAVTQSHPDWIARAMRQALLAHGRPAMELADLLAADNTAPQVTLVARPGLVSVDELAAQAQRADAGTPRRGRWSPRALVLGGGDPAQLPAVRRSAAGAQDEGSQLVALALAAAPLAPSEPGAASTGGDGDRPGDVADSADTGDRAWLDLCAGPGGKAALLGAIAHQRGAHLVANEVSAHRARLVRTSVAALPAGTVEVRTGDGREMGETHPGRFDRVIVDAPCTGLGALRRRPESRWRRSLEDLAALGPLQRALLAAALDATRPGGVVAYVTCSPHVAETTVVVEDVLGRRTDVEVLDAAAAVQEVANEPLPDLGDGPYVQLWPHLHGTDAMFLALIRKTA